MQALSPIQIRQATPPDAPVLAEILHESFVEYQALYTQEAFAATALNADQILTRMREGPVWLASREAEVLGTVAAIMKGESAYVRGMAVLPGARGSGVGARLLAQVEHWASDRECRRILLGTTPFLKAAIRLYQRSGFRRTDEGPHELFGTPLFTMEKDILRRG